jgi:hypothetical protein
MARAAVPPPTGGTIAIEARNPDGETDPEMASFVDAVSQTLTSKGFTIFDDPAHAAYRAELVLNRVGVGTGMGKDPHGDTIGVVGTGVVLPLSTGASSVVTLQRTRLEIRIRRRGDQTIIWNGAAVTVRGPDSRKGAEKTIASDLSEALLRSYPVEPTDVVGVP